MKMGIAIENPLKGMTTHGWHFEQNVYLTGGLVRTLKAGEGSGNIPKIIVYENIDIGRLQSEYMRRGCDRCGDNDLGTHGIAERMEDNGDI